MNIELSNMDIAYIMGALQDAIDARTYEIGCCRDEEVIDADEKAIEKYSALGKMLTEQAGWDGKI